MAPRVYLESKIFHYKTCKLTGYKTNRISRTVLGNVFQEVFYISYSLKMDLTVITLGCSSAVQEEWILCSEASFFFPIFHGEMKSLKFCSIFLCFWITCRKLWINHFVQWKQLFSRILQKTVIFGWLKSAC